MSSKHFGQVKWFNNKIGYGFITMINKDNHNNNRDIFVHHMNICPLESNYRTLRTGEYVEFLLEENCEGDHKEQATQITGIYGNELLCDFIYRNNTNKRTRPKPKETF
jgi:cold shock CspA family protein